MVYGMVKAVIGNDECESESIEHKNNLKAAFLSSKPLSPMAILIYS